jgi:hypothetical protein
MIGALIRFDDYSNQRAILQGLTSMFKRRGR